MGKAAHQGESALEGTAPLARDLTADELRFAPRIAYTEHLLIEDLTADEGDAFAAALDR